MPIWAILIGRSLYTWVSELSREFPCLTVEAVPSIMRKWRACLEQVQESSRRFSSLSDALPAEKISEWAGTEKFMQELRSVEVQVMDDYDVHDEQGSLFPKSPLSLSHAD